VRRRVALVGLAAVLAVFFALWPAGEGAAHDSPERRQIIAQAEADAAVFLVAWTSARSPQGSQLLGRALWGRRAPRARVALEALAAREALASLEIRRDGAPVSFTGSGARIDVEVKIDPRPPARVVAAVLITVPRRGAAAISLRDRSAERSRLMWIDRADGLVAGPDRPDRWLPGRRSLTLTWKPSPP
jgi:hypothetical protein